MSCGSPTGDHAVASLIERKIDKAWVERTIIVLDASKILAQGADLRQLLPAT